jgi:hypothetical protein
MAPSDPLSRAYDHDLSATAPQQNQLNPPQQLPDAIDASNSQGQPDRSEKHVAQQVTDDPTPATAKANPTAPRSTL